MPDLSVMIYVMWAVYAVFIVLGLALMILAIQLLSTLIRFLRTLNDYWRMRATAQYQSRKVSSDD